MQIRVWDKDKKRMSKPMEISEPFVKWTDGDVEMPTFFAVVKDERFVFMLYIDAKDREGNELCDGDIIENPSRNGGKPHPIIYSRERTAFVGDYGVRYTIGDEAKDIKIVGNIYQNPELISIDDANSFK
jgi:hypothetical protein